MPNIGIVNIGQSQVYSALILNIGDSAFLDTPLEIFSVKKKWHHTENSQSILFENQLIGFPYYTSPYRKVFPNRL